MASDMIQAECPHLDCLYNIDGKCHDARTPDPDECPGYRKRTDAFQRGGAEAYATPIPDRFLPVIECANASLETLAVPPAAHVG